MESNSKSNYWYDLHVHSCLSSCGQTENTPLNIIKQCKKNGLNLISITDHNSAKHYHTIEILKKYFDICIIYGMEVTSQEGYHVLCYFESYEKLRKFDDFIESNIDMEIKNPYAPSILTDEYGNMIDEVYHMINQPIKCSYELLAKTVRSLDGIIVLAHVNRGGSGILDFHKDISNFDFDAIEISKNGDLSLDMENIKKELFQKYPYLEKYKKLYNSDGHSLDRIHKQVYSIDLFECSFEGFKEWIKR